jgi:hypothetical protein
MGTMRGWFTSDASGSKGSQPKSSCGRATAARHIYGPILLLLALSGCAGPGPRLLPLTAIETRPLADGALERWHDTDADGRADYCERLSPAGRIVELRYTPKHGPAENVNLEGIPPAQRRDLVLQLDSLPYAVARDAWDEGLLRFCARPSRTISPFPVMSDLCFSEFFGCSPSPGIESCYFDGQQLTNGYDVYANEGNVHWQEYVNYRLDPVEHPWMYLDPYPWLSRELRAVEKTYRHRSAPMTVGYCAGTSAAGARHGLEGHRTALIEVDRSCRWLLYKTRGRVRFTLMSDHGHSYFTSKRLPLIEELTRLGYHVGEERHGPRDIVVPEFGMVTCAAIYTSSAPRVAKDVVGIAGVDLSVYRDESDELIVQNRTGRARILQAAGRYCYRPEQGDPLQLVPVIERLKREGYVDDRGFIDDRALFDATVDAVYPDALHRLWRTFHGLIEHTPDVVVSVEEGHHCGSALMSSMVPLLGVHGNLKQPCSGAFAMTSAGELPAVLRTEDLRAAFHRLGVEIPGKGALATASIPSPRDRTRPKSARTAGCTASHECGG